MKIVNRYSVMLLTGLTLIVGACEIEEINDPNNPSLGSVLTNASKPELQVLVTGLEARNRGYVENANQLFGSFGREVLPYFGSDPRFPNEWLGLGIAETYPDFFASAGTYVQPYLAVKQANVLIQAAENSTNITEDERFAYTGLAKTIKGFQLIWPLMQQYQNGIRVDVTNPLDPGPILEYDAALSEIRGILADGAADLQRVSDMEALPYNLTAGFAGFESIAGLLEINNAIAARVALYDEDFTGALQALEGSFMDLSVTTPEGLQRGPVHIWGNAPDQPNPLYYPLDRQTSTILIVHPAMIDDALPGDRRLEKFARRVENPASNANIKLASGELIPGEYQDARYQSPSDPTPFIRNEELILIYAEAQARKSPMDLEEAIRAVNIIRNIWGLPDYQGEMTQDAVIDEILFQRRYSLWLEGGHRWIDLRRTGRLNANYVDMRAQGNLFTQVARRSSETNWNSR
ncbi:RagB/SusD family nutrient uptake outer membrane protein [Cesiribacter andamanensis]|uniref:SusD family protein n=1 Tax=Cesiribacter andamanensis AMV16 TaxID=1279009 RepID=M7NQ19_9BACT|nr:RagB/SusD family nutrient uptake outer membrane protein [Cesiribacter andamanensis]EMR03805.1 SusD family protein [Cesiribacter andamanensis AMV16]